MYNKREKYAQEQGGSDVMRDDLTSYREGFGKRNVGRRKAMGRVGEGQTCCADTWSIVSFPGPLSFPPFAEIF